MIDKDMVIWRFDPLIITPLTNTRDLLIKIWTIGNKLKGYTSKLVFSFIDVDSYRKVQLNLVKETNFYNKENVIHSNQLSMDQIQEIAEVLVKIKKAWHDKGWNIELSTCAERINLEKYDITHNHCIDQELMERLFSDDKNFLHYLVTGNFLKNYQLKIYLAMFLLKFLLKIKI